FRNSACAFSADFRGEGNMPQCAPWYRREDYDRIRAIMDDGPLMPPTFDEWEATASHCFLINCLIEDCKLCGLAGLTYILLRNRNKRCVHQHTSRSFTGTGDLTNCHTRTWLLLTNWKHIFVLPGIAIGKPLR